MGLSISTETLNIIGIVYSALAITISVLNVRFLKAHSRSLDNIQWAYFLAIYIQMRTLVPFSMELEVGSSFITLPPASTTNFFCPMGLYVCRAPFALSFLVILVGLLLILRLITIPQKVREKVSFLKIYESLKGFFKWFYAPLFVLSLEYLFLEVESELIPSVVILAILILFPIIQLFFNIMFGLEEEDRFVKWLEFASYIKAALFSLLIILFYKYSSTVFLFLMILLLPTFATLFVWKKNFYYPKFGRVLYIFGEIIFIFLFSLFAGFSPWLQLYYLDLFGLGIILLFDIIYTIMELIEVFKEWRVEVSNAVLPEESRAEEEQQNKRLEVSEDINEIHEMNKIESRDQLHESRDSAKDIFANNSTKRTNSNSKNKLAK